MSIFDIFRHHSCLNVDGYDRRTYGQLRKNSAKIAELEEKGSQQLPSFPHLMGDIWSGLYKNNPRVLDEVPAEVIPNRPLMENLFTRPEFTELREHTKLDELASALGLLHLGQKMDEFLKDNLPEDVKDQVKDMADTLNEAQKHSDRADALKEALQGEEAQTSQLKDRLKKDLASANRKAGKAEKKAEQLAESIQQAMGSLMESSGGQEALGKVLVGTQAEVKDDTNALKTFFGGLSAGTQPGEKVHMNPAMAIQLAEAIRKQDKLKKIAELTGRMKKIARKKQKSKTHNTTERTDVSLGNDPARLLPQEICLLSRGDAKGDFLRRFAEGKLLQYSPESKEKLGKGPIVVCIDTSGSMKELDPESKAIALALLGISRRQKRAFALINFASSHQIRKWEYAKPRNIPHDEIIRMAELFFNGGTDFERPIDEAVSVINNSKFKKADIVFITDGEAKVGDTWLNEFHKSKKRKRFQVISVQLGNRSTDCLKKFSDQVIQANSLFESAVTDKVLSI